jgi:polyphenol oxidase
MENSIWYAVQEENVVAGTTTRHGGVSLGAYASLNLAFHTGDDPQAVHQNRQRFSNLIDLPLTSMVWTHQSHSTILRSVSRQEAGRGLNRFEDGVPGDALYTQEKNLLLAIFHADCVPVFIVHRQKPLVAMIHAGTPGSLQKITFKSVKQLQIETHINLSEVDAYLGPSLDFAHHPINQKRVDEILKIDPTYQAIIKKIGNQFFLDIPLLNYLQLIDAGVPSPRIHVSNLDTFSNPKDYFSYDRDGVTGRHLSFIYLR